MISVDEALRAVTEAFVARDHGPVSILDALGSFVALPVLAKDDSPAFDQSAMDGYAVRAEDLAPASSSSPMRLRVVA